MPPATTRDVGILYEIITHAEQDSNVQAHPFRSIFTAYDTVLARHGLDPDHDQVYLRFLLRLGGKKETGETLYRSFESLLAELGIQIEINPEENEIQDVTRSFNATANNSPGLQTRSEAGSDAGTRSRRASYHSLAGPEGKRIAADRARSSSRTSFGAPRRHQIASVQDRPSTRATTRPSERSGLRALSSQSAAQPARGRLTSREFASNLQHYQRRHASASTVRSNTQDDRNNFGRHSRAQSAQGPLIQPQPQSSSPIYELSMDIQDDQQDGRYSDEQHGHIENHAQAYQPDARELFYHPTDTQLIRDADTFLHFRLRAVMRNILGRWRITTLGSKQRHERIASTALAYDHGVLLRQSFDLWRIKLQMSIETAAAERYFIQLEQKAEKARDLYLLTKAFTHWQHVVREKIENAAEARRQVLRMKYFHAWLTFTLENHQKVRLHGERKFFTVWNRRLSLSLVHKQKASSMRARNLVKATYWKWFWVFCERRAPEWKHRRLQTAFFNHWAFSSQEKAWREYEVTVGRHRLVKKKMFSIWLQQARTILSNSKVAEDTYQQKIMARSMLECRRQVRYAPLSRQIFNMADWRIAGSTFATFVNRFRNERRAHRVDELRVTRNVWTAWNDRLRWQTLESQIDDRVLVQALYRWVLAERCLLLERLCDQRRTRLCVTKLVQLHRTRAAAQHVLFEEMERKRQASAVKLLIDRWRCTVHTYQQHAQIAFEFEAPRVAQQAMSALALQLDHVRKLNKWAVDARYYFHVTRFLKVWRAATAESKRRKLHNAYALIRRSSKMKLARSCIRTWQDRTRHIRGMKEQASSHEQTKLLYLGASLFDRWRHRLIFIMDREDEIVLEFERRFVHSHLDIWMSKLRTASRNDEVAQASADDRIASSASKCLHELRLRIVELRGRESKAQDLRKWYEKRHLRDLLRRWREQTAKKRDQPLGPPSFSSARARRLGNRPVAAASQDDVDGRAEEWTAFDEGGFDVGEWIPGLGNVEASSTPLPAYLSTPSKRAARARGLPRVSTTPIGTPVTERLRSQLNKTPSRRGAFGRSHKGFGGSAFGTIPESEPKTPEGA
ncbi:MAG: hypothetical protein LQ346_000068 [Caloplaca aetnensis]|nr:MAG: hypothetical protein LQ346_000068 [Caloplaca aetnensis]